MKKKNLTKLILVLLTFLIWSCQSKDDSNLEGLDVIQMYSQSKNEWHKTARFENLEEIIYYHDENKNPVGVEFVFSKPSEIEVFHSLIGKKIRIMYNEEILCEGIIRQKPSGRKIFCEGGKYFPTEKTKINLGKLVNNGISYKQMVAGSYKLSNKKDLEDDVSSMFSEE